MFDYNGVGDVSVLSDIERKVLRILTNLFRVKGRPPSIVELQRWTGRSRHGVHDILRSLATKGYIGWTMDEPERIMLLRTDEERQGIGHWGYD